MQSLKTFLQASEQKAFNLKHRFLINENIEKYQFSFQKASTQFQDLDLAKDRAAYIKTEALEHLDQYLEEFEQKIAQKGGKVLWAENSREALRYIEDILAQKQATKVIKSKSITTEEIELNEFLENQKIEIMETDLGELIVQLAHQKPYHIVTPAMHLSKETIQQIFKDKLNISTHTNTAEELTQIARHHLRQKFLEAEVGITGANFLVADVGGIAITENEGNARLTYGFPKTHIVLVGIEKVLPKLEDLELFWSLLATHGTGQKITAYNSLITAPNPSQELIVILLDNGRTKLLADASKRQALNCIRCGACLNVCPVFQNIGGHTYQTPYSGPIGAVIMPHLKGMKQYGHLSQASSLCGACGEICPVKIELPQLLLQNRQQAIQEGYGNWKEAFVFRYWERIMLKPNALKGWVNFKNRILHYFFGRKWSKRRRLPSLAAQSFREMWKETVKK